MISIIVPIYNVEKYLEECLLSIQNQTYQDFECIMVNDGSPDNSKVIAEKFLTDSRFKLINQGNRGLSAARNVGIEYSTGEYITFVDSDDVINEEYLSILTSYIGTDIDIVESNYYRGSKRKDKGFRVVFNGIAEEAIKNMALNKGLRHNPWAKLYKKEIFEKTRFPEGVYYEDILTGIECLINCKKVLKINYEGYYWRIRKGSQTQQDFSDRNLDIFKICDKVEDIFKEDSKLAPYVYRYLFGHIAYHYIWRGKKSSYRHRYEEYMKKYSEQAYDHGMSLKIYKKYPKKYYWFSISYRNINKIRCFFKEKLISR